MANDLKMEVILQAIDRATRPIKAVMQGSIGLGQALKDSRAQLKQLQTAQNDVSSFKRLHAISQNTEGALKAQQNTIKALSREIAASGAPTKAMTANMQAAIRRASELKQQHKQQQTELQGLRSRLKDVGINTRSLSEDERTLRSRIKATNGQISEQSKRMQRLSAQTKRLTDARRQYDKTQQLAGSMAGVGAGATAMGAATGMPVLATVNSYIDFEDAMAGVAKQVAGARDDNGELTATYHQMADSIKQMSTRIPMVTTEIAALVEGAARMGVEGTDNLLAFTETAANAATAFELPADQISENLARIADLYKIPIANVSALGDAINYLDDNAKSKGADIIDVLTRTAGITTSVGMSYKDAAALGSTFLTLGATAEVAGTATNAMIRELAIATQQPKRFQKGLAALGLEAEKLQNGMSENATETLISVLEAVNRLPKNKQIGVATQLFGKEFGDDAAKLAQNISEYRRQLELVNSSAGEGSMQREADIRAALTSAQLQMAKNQAFNLAAGLGETLKPALLEVVNAFNRVVGSVSEWVKANPELAGSILKGIAMLALLATGFGAVTLAMAGILGPFAMARYAMALFSIKGGSLIATLLNLGRVALPLVGKAILFIGRALMMNPIGLAVTAIAGAAYLIYKNWEPIKAFFLGLWAEIKAGFNGGLAGIAATILNFSPLGLFYRAFAATMGYFGIELPSKFTDFGSMLLDGLITGITNKLGAVKNTITGVADSTVGWFKEKLGIHSPSRVFAEMGGHTMAGLDQGLSGNQGGPLATIKSIAQQLAAAGAVSLASSGPALAMDTRAPLSANTQRAQPVVQGDTYHITIQASAGTDIAGLEQMLTQLLDKRERSKAARLRSALNDQE